MCRFGGHHTTFDLRQTSIKENDSITNQRIMHLDERTQGLVFQQPVLRCCYEVNNISQMLKFKAYVFLSLQQKGIYSEIPHSIKVRPKVKLDFKNFGESIASKSSQISVSFILLKLCQSRCMLRVAGSSWVMSKYAAQNTCDILLHSPLVPEKWVFSAASI